MRKETLNQWPRGEGRAAAEPRTILLTQAVRSQVERINIEPSDVLTLGILRSRLSLNSIITILNFYLLQIPLNCAKVWTSIISGNTVSLTINQRQFRHAKACSIQKTVPKLTLFGLFPVLVMLFPVLVMLDPVLVMLFPVLVMLVLV